MTVNSERFTVNLSIDSNIFEDHSTECVKLLEGLSKKSLSFLLIENSEIFQQLNLKTPLRIIPIYSILNNNPLFHKHPEIAQIDYLGNKISPYFCPNNPKLEIIINKMLDSLNFSPKIAGIQLKGLEMPSLSHYQSCFCPHCSTIAEKKGLDLNKISNELKEKAKTGINERWICKKFPDWLRFRADSVSNLAGKIMVLSRKKNPDFILGLNLSFSETAEIVGQNYFFLALYLDMLNFVVNTPPNFVGKKLLKQIRSISKKFLGDIKLYLQLKVPNEFNLNIIRRIIAKIEKNFFNGIFLHISTLNELKEIRMI